MPQNDLKFFTNEPDRDLYSRFSNILKSNTQFFDILVGYFRTSGFFRMYEAMEDVEKIRILVGLNVDKYTVKIIDKARSEVAYEMPTMKEAKEFFAENVEDEFNKSATTSAIEQGVRTFIEWLKNGKLEMRMYVDAPIHAKVYIMRKDQDKVPDTFGTVITGSSNFSEAGLQNNLEFNVELKDSSDVHFALDKFEELWAKGVPITEDYIEAVEKRTWLRNDITPYEIYLKTLYEFFKEEINADRDMLAEDLLPDGYMRLQYQIDAVVQAKKILEAYNGVFVSDVVGLGKTYICAMLAKSLKKGRKLIICPPVLVDYWKDVLLEFDVAAEVESLGKLDRILEKGDVDKYRYVFIDEAHRFRNSQTESFSQLHKICYGKKVVLISATPINNYSSDIENQITLFQPKHNSTIVGVKNIEQFFRNLRSKENKYTKGTQMYLDQVRANSEEIRDKILRHIMIRRTRGEIIEYYKDDLERQGLKFPKLGTPEPIAYVFDEDTNNVFNDTVELIKNFKYSRYKPLVYLKDTKKYASLLAAQHNMGGFMKSVLVKRLESSFFAFKNTLRRFEESYEKFIDMYEKGEVYISKKVDVYDMLDSGDDDKLMALVEDELVMHFKSEEFDEKFIKDLKWDLSKLKYLKETWDTITEDPKLLQFKEELKTNKKLIGNKKIIFTESKETAEYLERELKELFGERVISYTGSSNHIMKTLIEQSFNPKFKDKEDLYDVLITTDVLAEGINLHRSNALINYDLPWNPTRIMQRVGRINRVGTEHEQIYVFNFFPTAATSKHLPLKDRIIEKLQAFHDTLGEDFKYLSEEEEVSSQKLFNDLNMDLNTEEESANPELQYLAIIRLIRDNDKDVFEKIKRLPRKAKTGRASEKIKDEATITFIRKGALKSFFICQNNDSEEVSFIDAIDYLKCEPDEKKLAVGKNYFDHYDSNNDAFDKSLVEEEIITTAKKAGGSNDTKMIRTLRSLQSIKDFTDDQEDNIKKMIEAWENGDIPAADTKKILKEISTAKDGVEAYYKIVGMLDEKYLGGRQQVAAYTVDGEKQVILSCYLKGDK